MAAHGAHLSRALLLAVADSCPRQLARSLSGLLYALVGSATWGPAAGAWLGAVLQAPDFLGEGRCGGAKREGSCFWGGEGAVLQAPDFLGEEGAKKGAALGGGGGGGGGRRGEQQRKLAVGLAHRSALTELARRVRARCPARAQRWWAGR